MNSDPIDLEKYRSIGAIKAGSKKNKKKTPIGPHGGSQTEHWDGRVDAHIVVPATKMSSKLDKAGE